MKVKQIKDKKIRFLRELIVVASFGSVPTEQSNTQTSITPSSSVNIQFTDDVLTKKEEKSVIPSSSAANFTPPITPAEEQKKTEEKDQSTKPKSYRDAIGKKEKITTTDENPAAAAAASETKATKSAKQKASKSANRNARSARSHPQDANDYYDDSWYYGTAEEGYLHTGYTDDQEVFVGNLSTQVTEAEVN